MISKLFGHLDTSEIEPTKKHGQITGFDTGFTNALCDMSFIAMSSLQFMLCYHFTAEYDSLLK